MTGARLVVSFSGTVAGWLSASAGQLPSSQLVVRFSGTTTATAAATATAFELCHRRQFAGAARHQHRGQHDPARRGGVSFEPGEQKLRARTTEAGRVLGHNGD